MADGLKINITADVAQATQGLSAVEVRATQLQINIKKLQDVIANTTSQKKLSSALSALDQQQRAYNQTLVASSNKLGGVSPTANQATAAISNLSRVVQDAPFGFIGIANNINPLLESFQRLKTTSGSTGGALKALGSSLLGGGGLGLALAAVTTGITLAQVGFDRWFKTTKDAKKSSDELKDSIKGIYSETAKEVSAVNGFVAILNSETETRKRKLEAIKELQAIQPEVFNGLKLEGEAVVGLDAAYQNYIQNLQTVIAVKIKQAQQEQLIEKLLKAQGVTLTANEKLLAEGTKRFQQAFSNDPRLGPEAGRVNKYYKDQENASKSALDKLKSDIKALQDEITQLSSGIETKPLTIKAKVEKLDFSEFLQVQEIELPIKFSDDPQFYSDSISPVGALINKEIISYFKKNPIDDPTLLKEYLKFLGNKDKPLFSFLGFENLTKEQKELAETGQIIANTLTPSLEAMVLAISKGENAFRAFGEGVKAVLLQVIQKLTATAILAGILATLFPSGIGGTQGFGAIFGKLLGFRANGGPVSGNSPYIVGERGPELFVPSVSGSIVPNNAVGSFMGGRMGDSGRGTTLRGQDIILAYARTQRSQLRVNG